MPPEETPVTFDDAPALELEVRDVEAREIVGRIIPYGETITIRGRPESFAPGALANVDPSSVRLLAYHDRNRPIGRMLALEERSDGAYGVFKVARTPLGDEMLELARDGVVQFSPGFFPGRQSRTGAHLELRAMPEVSLVVFGSYRKAEVLAVREGDPMPPEVDTPAAEIETRSDPAIEALEVRMGELSTVLDRLASVVDTPAPRRKVGAGPTPFDWFRAQIDAAAGRFERRERLEEEWAEYQTRQLEDITGDYPENVPADDISGVVVEEFIASQLVNVLDRRRRLFSRLGSFPMPRSGHAKIPVVTQHTEVAVRTGQKDPANSRKMIVTTEGFDAVWYDGAVDIALEVIRMAELPVVEMVWNDLLGQYAIATEAGLAATIEAGGLGFDYTGTPLDVTDYEGFITDVATQAIAVEDGSGAPATLLAVTNTQWIAILTMIDADGRRHFSTIGASNADGSAPLNADSVSLPGGIEVFRAPGLTAAVLTNAESLKVADGGPERVEALNVELMGRDLGLLGRTMFVPRIPAGVVVFGADPVS